ncbi:MAG: response regulator transcription factor [Alphaproteobacteria bacterium]
MRVLVVEDDPDVGEDLAHSLREAGFVVDLSRAGTDALFLGDTEDYAAAVLDLGLPELDGLSVLRRWRESQRNFPVLILTARSDWTEKVEGIEAGADDYLTKPFEMGELIARMRGLLRRAAGHSSPVIRFGRLALDTARLEVRIDSKTVRLSPLEYRFLELLAHHPGQAVPVHVIGEHLYGVADNTDKNAIEALVKRLRQKVGQTIIETRRGFGYTISNSNP